MSYMALYRKWRPDTFSEVKGQDHIVQTFKNQLTHQRIGHAYLFTGTRGTGKTTVAKLLAKAVNCEHPREDGSPCLECASCKSIGEGSSMNVIEIDAASNNGVDNIREIREEVQYSPTDAKYRVYIIDEVHMLSSGAFNALLKTLEEPPSYVIFILATTEVHKIPITIMSRCQRYDFHRISLDTIADRLAELMERENQPVEREALLYIAKMADGSMRDALSLLDRCISFYLGETLTYENCLDILGAVDTEVFLELLRAVNEKNIDRSIELIDGIVMEGRDLSQFIQDYTWFLRNMLLLLSSPESVKRLDYSKEILTRMQEETGNCTIPALIRYIRIFSELSGKIRYVSNKRVSLEVTIIKLCVPEMEINTDSILQRMDDLSKQVEECMKRPATVVTQEAPAATQAIVNATEAPKEKTLEDLRKELPAATIEEMQTMVANIKQAYSKLDPPVRVLLNQSEIRLDKEKQTIVVIVDDTNLGILGEQAAKDQFEQALAETSGRLIPIEYRNRSKNKQEEKDSYNMKWFEDLGVPVEITED